MKIVFMGTPHFAVPSLKKLIDEKYDITAVVTQPDRKRGRGQKVVPSPVKEVAQSHGIEVLQFEKIRMPEGVSALKRVSPDLIITAAFGQILSKEILDIPPMGCLNVHASLLPKYRGAAPIQWVIINGEAKTGVTIMYMDEKLDTGDIISKVSVDISDDMTGGQLYEELAHKGADLLLNTLKKIKNGTAIRTKQDDSQASYYPMLNSETGRIDWNKPAREIKNLVRALDPVPGAYSSINGETIRIWSVEALAGSASPGSIISADPKNGFIIGTLEGLIRVREMQAAGSKRMTAEEYLRGRNLPGESFC